MLENDVKFTAAGLEDEYALIIQARNNDEDAFAKLYRQYLPVIFWCVSSFSPPESEKDDLVQEGVIGLLKAIRTYDNVSSSFKTYASLCVKRAVISALRKYNRLHMGARNTAGCVPAATAGEIAANAEEKSMLASEHGRRLYTRFLKELSPFEKQILSLYLSGMSYAEMAKRQNRTVKSVDNAMTRIKNKIKKRKIK